jgi:hypothetical protein
VIRGVIGRNAEEDLPDNLRIEAAEGDQPTIENGFLTAAPVLQACLAVFAFNGTPTDRMCVTEPRIHRLGVAITGRDAARTEAWQWLERRNDSLSIGPCGYRPRVAVADAVHTCVAGASFSVLHDAALGGTIVLSPLSGLAVEYGAVWPTTVLPPARACVAKAAVFTTPSRSVAVVHSTRLPTQGLVLGAGPELLARRIPSSSD